MTQNAWFESVRRYTESLVKIRSVSPGEGEITVAQEVLRLLSADGFASLYTASGLDPLENDPHNRLNAYAFLRGQSPFTLVLLGHIDTVDTKDYGALEPWALDPEALTARRALLSDNDSDDWMFGRGIVDMKSGVAINIALMRHLASRETPPPLSFVMLATPDEENESAGVLQAVHFLLRLREQYGLTYIGAINTDYTTALYPGDPLRYVYAGTIGKLLPSFLCIGRESHVGDPFHGLDANLLAAELICDLSMDETLCDATNGQLAAPPVTLHATDLKSHYDVQLPFAAYFYLNVLTLTTDPAALLSRLQQRSEAVLTCLLQRIDQVEARWRARSKQGDMQKVQPRSGTVISYADLYRDTVQQLGTEHVNAALTEQWQLAGNVDTRERCLQLVYRLWMLSGKQGPAIVVYYSPPYYPHVAPTPGLLYDAVNMVIAAHPEELIELREFFPYLSDMSYLRLDAGTDLLALQANIPVWQQPALTGLPGGYALPFDAIQQLALPVINWGPYGHGAHQRNERILLSYSFGTLPQLLYETIEQLGMLVTKEIT